jgi:hypothetical protein
MTSIHATIKYGNNTPRFKRLPLTNPSGTVLIPCGSVGYEPSMLGILDLISLLLALLLPARIATGDLANSPCDHFLHGVEIATEATFGESRTTSRVYEQNRDTPAAL